MALVNCHECQKQVSDSARVCPNCGAPVSATQKRILKWNLTVLIIGLFFMLLIAIGGCLMMKKVSQSFQFPPPSSTP